MFNPGETTPMVFTLPFDAAFVKKATVGFNQFGTTVLQLETENIVSVTTKSCNAVFVPTQAESLQIRDDVACLAQVNVITADGVRRVGKPVYIHVGKQSVRNLI